MSHRTAELRSIALHELVAQRIESDPAIVDHARARVSTWLTDQTIPTRWAQRWLELLDGPRSELLAALTADTQEAADLRQVTPFAGVVPERERQDIIRRIRRDAS